jgi:hypothetical protein
VLVVLLGAAPFLVARRGPFLFDDTFLVAGDPRVRDLGLWRRWFTEDFWNVPYATAQLAPRLRYWRPLVTASFALDHARAPGAGTVPFHDTNVALHAIVSLLTLVLLRRLAFAPLPAAAGALVAAWHPARVESVAWIVGRTDVLCAIGIVLVLVADGLRSRAAALALGAVGVVIAFTSKETAVALPLVVLGARLLGDGRTPGPFRWRPALRRHAPVVLGLAALAIGYLAARRAWMPMTELHPQSMRLDRRALAVLESLGRYVELTCAPYDVTILRAGIRRDAHGFVPTWPFVVAGLAAAAAAWVAVRRVRGPLQAALVGGLLVFLGPLAPCLNVVPTGMAYLVAPRFLYVPLVAFAVAAAWAAERAIEARRAWVPAAFAVAFGLASFGRASDFRTLDTFWDAEARSAPDSLAVHLARIGRFMAERKHAAALAEAKQSVLDSIAHGESGAMRDASIEAVLRAASKLLPDASRDEVERLRRFVVAVERGAPPGVLELPSLALVVDLEKLRTPSLAAARPRLGTIATELAIRLGDDDDARARLDAVLAAPGVYLEVLGPYVSFAAKLGDAAAVERLAAVAVEPMRSEWRALAEAVREDERSSAAGGLARVGVLARRELHGRALEAYEGLAPELRAHSPLDHAALLVRAGYTERGRAVLAREAAAAFQGRAEADALVARWAAETDWGRGE